MRSKGVILAFLAFTSCSPSPQKSVDTTLPDPVIAQAQGPVATSKVAESQLQSKTLIVASNAGEAMGNMQATMGAATLSTLTDFVPKLLIKNL